MPIPLRGDFEIVELRREARNSKDSGLGAPTIGAGCDLRRASTCRTEADKIGGVTLQIVRDWVMKFNTHGPSGLIAGKAAGSNAAPERASTAQPWLAMVEDGLDPCRSWRGALAACRPLPANI